MLTSMPGQRRQGYRKPKTTAGWMEWTKLTLPELVYLAEDHNAYRSIYHTV